ncbi:DUF418 domain-containing protein [Phenylobacterium sp.]|uniref:DUF418 domain-containing protein n=1 Tax=Phenylobacterium sp. TaxID=1871053 RepID=UPI002811B944|nr:DUF418 domain-containing protein [Phenylobacterium sp.]
MVVAAAPVAQGERIRTLDVLRGVAVCGILLMNIPAMGLLWSLPRPMLPAQANADWIAYTIQMVTLEGSMRGLFTLLFGAGMLVMLRGAANAAAPAIQAYLTRCFALMLLGFANFAIFLWPGEILFNYGVCGLALLLFWRADVRVLVTAAAAILIAMTVHVGNGSFKRAETIRDGQAAAAAKAEGKTLSEAQKKALEGHTKMMARLHPDAKAIADERKERTTFPAVAKWSIQQWVKFNFGESAWAILGESLAMMLLGMALFRLNVLSGERPLGFYLTLAAVGYGVGLTIRGLFALLQWRHGFEPNPTVAGLFGWIYQLGRVPTTLGLLGVVVALYKLGALRLLESGLTAIGRLALTNYVGQSVITSVLFYGLGYWNRFGFAQLMGLTVLIWIAQGIFSLLWLRRWQMGPLEWLLRSVTYGRWRPLDRTSAASAAGLAPAE